MTTNYSYSKKLLNNNFKNSISRNLNLLWALSKRDFIGRYRRSILGPFWAIIQPFIMMVIFTMLRGFVNIPSDGIPYPIFSYSVLVPWTFFSTAINTSGPSIMSNIGIIKKIPVAREIFPLSSVLLAFVDMIISSVILLGMMAYYRVPVNLNIFWLIPLTLLIMVFAWSIGLFIAAFGTYKQDFMRASGFIIQFAMYASPIIYSLNSVPDKWKQLYILNPLVGILEGFRAVLALGETPDLTLVAWGLPVIILTTVISVIVFRRMSQYFVDVL